MSIFLANIPKAGVRALASPGLLKKGLGVGARKLNSESGKKLVDEGIKRASEQFKFQTSNVKNKGFKKALE